MAIGEGRGKGDELMRIFWKLWYAMGFVLHLIGAVAIGIGMIYFVLHGDWWPATLSAILTSICWLLALAMFGREEPI